MSERRRVSCHLVRLSRPSTWLAHESAHLERAQDMTEHSRTEETRSCSQKDTRMAGFCSQVRTDNELDNEPKSRREKDGIKLKVMNIDSAVKYGIKRFTFRGDVRRGHFFQDVIVCDSVEVVRHVWVRAKI